MELSDQKNHTEGKVFVCADSCLAVERDNNFGFSAMLTLDCSTMLSRNRCQRCASHFVSVLAGFRQRWLK